MPEPTASPTTQTMPRSKKGKSNLDNWWVLSNAKNNSVRVDAASRLLTHAAKHADERDYLLKRLLRGLASPNESSRQGFFVCLVEFLRQTEISVSEVIETVKDVLRQVGSKGEEAFYHLGQILASVALLRSGRPLTPDDKTNILQMILYNGTKRSYLLLMALKAVIEHFMEMPVKTIISTVSEFTKLSASEANIDTLYLTLALYNSRKAEFSDKDCQELFGSKSPTKNSSLEHVVRVLTSTTLPLHSIKQHPIIGCICFLLADNVNAVKRLWGLLLAEISNSSYKGNIALLLFREIIKEDIQHVSELLNEKTFEALVTLVQKGQSEAVKEILELVMSGIKDGKLACSDILPRVVKYNPLWDKLAPGGFVSHMITCADAETVMAIGKIYRSMAESDARFPDRVYCGNQLARLIGHPTIHANLEWRTRNLEALMELYLICPANKGKALPAPRENRGQEKENSFFRGLDARSKTLADNANIVNALMKHAKDLLNGGGKPIKSLSDDAMAAWKELQGPYAKLAKAWSKQPTKENGVFLMFFGQIGLQLFSEPEMAMDVLAELYKVYQNWNKQLASADEPDSVEVIVEVMLTLLAQNKHLLRQLVTCVFTVLCQNITTPALQSILAALKLQEAEADDSESEPEDEDAEDDDDDSDEDEDNSEDDDKMETEDSEQSDDESDNEEKESPADEELRTKFREVLGKHAGQVSDDEDEEEDLDMDAIPDEEMAKLDAKLADAFRALGGKKTGSEKKRERLDLLAKQHFRLRVLELVEIYISHKPEESHILLIITSLIESFKQSLKAPGEETFNTRLKAALKRCCSIKYDGDAAGGEDVLPTLDALLDLGVTASPLVLSLSNLHARLTSFVLRLAVGKNAAEAEAIYLKHLGNFFHNSQCVLTPEVFQLAVGFSWPGSCSIAKGTIEKAFKGKVRLFRKTQALSILTVYTSNKLLCQTFAKENRTILPELMDLLVNEMSPNSPAKNKPNHLLGIAKLIKSIKQHSGDCGIDWEDVRSKISDLAQGLSLGKQNQALRKNFKKMLNFLGVSVNFQQGGNDRAARAADGGQPKVTSEGDQQQPGEGKNKKKKKKKKSAEQQQKKKENKLKMAAAQAEEGVPSFSEFVVDSTEASVAGSEPSAQQDKKKKKNKKKRTEADADKVADKSKKRKSNVDA